MIFHAYQDPQNGFLHNVKMVNFDLFTNRVTTALIRESKPNHGYVTSSV